jgi:hypothetical protein
MQRWGFMSIERLSQLRLWDQIAMAAIEHKIRVYSWAQDLIQILDEWTWKIYCHAVDALKEAIAQELDENDANYYINSINQLQEQMSLEYDLYLWCKHQDWWKTCSVLKRIHTIPGRKMEWILNNMKSWSFPVDEYQVLFNKVQKQDRNHKLTNLCKELDLEGISFLFQRQSYSTIFTIEE